MTEQQAARSQGPSDPPAGAAQPEEGQWGEPAQGGQAREWMSQLQSMIENLATQAVPVARQIGAKAAELAAVAAEKAGPIAAKAAEVTADAGTRFAERSRNLATELRRDAEADASRQDPAAPAGDAEADVAGSGGGDAPGRLG